MTSVSIGNIKLYKNHHVKIKDFESGQKFGGKKNIYNIQEKLHGLTLLKRKGIKNFH